MTKGREIERVLVTGASSGIGRAVAEQLLAEGRRVVLTGRDAHRLSQVAQAAPKNARVVPFDFIALGDMPAFADAAWAAFEGLDGVVHAAGILRRGAVDEVTLDDLRGLAEVNAFAPFLLAQALAAKTEPDGRSVRSMTFVASTLALRAAPGTSAYAASKAALIALARSLALEVAPRGVRVNVIAPGIVETPMTQDRVAQHRAVLDGLHPLGGVGSAKDVARATIALLDMPWTTGTVLNVDGGSLLRE